MNKIRYKALAVCLSALFVMFGLTACTRLTYEYERTGSVTFFEPYAEEACLINGKKFTAGNAVVYFDDGFGDKRQQKWLDFAVDALNLLAPDKTVAYYVGDGLTSRADTTAVYLGTDDRTVFLLATMQYLGDARLNYGLLWGAAEYLRMKLEGKKLKSDDAVAAKLVADRPELTDFEAPLFYTPHVLAEETGDAGTVAVSFVRWLIKEKGEEGLKKLLEKNMLALGEEVAGNYFYDYERDFTALKNEWLAAIGADFTVVPRDIFVRYAPFSSKYPLLIETDWGRLYLESGYVSPYKDTRLEKYDVRYSDFSYCSMKSLLADMDTDARSMLADFGMTYDDVQPKFDYFLDDKYYYYGIGGQVNVGGPVLLCSLAHWAHEFCHVIYCGFGFYDSHNTGGVNSQRWLSEGMACYMQEQRALTDGFTASSLELVIEDEEYRDYYALIRPLSDSDARAMEDVFAYFSVAFIGDYGSVTNYSYYRYTSFVYWLTERFGFETLASYAKDEITYTEAFGSDISSLWREWGTELFANFGDATPPEDFLSRIA